MCGFIAISINNKVKNSTFLYKIDHEKDVYKSENKKILHPCFHDNIILNALF